MRVRLLILTVAALVLAACGGDNPKTTPSSTPGAAVPTADTRLIAVDPKLLPLDEKSIIAGTWKVSENSLASGQYSRRFERDAADPALATGTLRVDIIARLFETVNDAGQDFSQTCAGPGGLNYVQSAILPRGFTTAEIRVTQPPVDAMGADDQSFWRAEYGKPGGERLVTYTLCLRTRNSRVILSTIAPMKDGAELPNLLNETLDAGKRQAQHLNDILQKMPPAPRAIATRAP